MAAGYKYHRTSSRLVAVTSLWLWAVPDGLPVPPTGTGYELPWGDPLSQTWGWSFRQKSREFFLMEVA